MGLEEVKDEILQEAESKADSIKREAEEKAESIRKEAEEKAEEIREKHKEELEDKKENLRKQGLSNARMKAKEEKLRAREESLSEVFEEFRFRLDDMEEDEREKFVDSCLEKVEFDIGKVIGGSEFEDAVNVDFEEKEDVEGIIVVSDDETRRQSFTFEKIVQQFKDEYRKQVAEKLF